MIDGAHTRRLVVVAGGGSPVGQRICARLARDESFIVVWDERFGAALSVVAQIEREGGEAGAFQVDLKDPEAIGRAAMLTTSEWGMPAVLVNCGFLGAPVETQMAVSGACVRAFSSILKDARSGLIVNVFCSDLQSTEDRDAIAASTQTLAKGMAPFGIRVYGLVGAEINASVLAEIERTPSAGDVADSISLLCSAACNAVSGGVISL